MGKLKSHLKMDCIMLDKSVFVWLHALIIGYWFSAAGGGAVGGAWVRHGWSSGGAVVGHADLAPLIYVYNLLIW